MVSSPAGILRRAIAGAAALTCAGCGSASRPIELRDRLNAGGGTIEITIRLQPEHRAYGERYQRGAASALRICGELFGRFDTRVVTLVDPPWSAQPVRDAAPGILSPLHWWSTMRSMGAELVAARATVAVVIAGRFARSHVPTWFIDGLVEIIARRAVVPLFQGENLAPGYAFVETRSFGAFVPAFVRLRMMPETDGPPVSAYRRDQSVRPSLRAEATDYDALAGKTVLALGTLERWLGRPTLDGILAEFFEHAGEASHLADFEQIASAASGQDLSWFFNQVFQSAARFDYAVASFSTTTTADGSFTTAIAVRRGGGGQFTGSSGPRVGDFESGRGVTLQVTFADGHTRLDHWDGREAEKTFRYRSTSPATAAVVDPDRVLLLDLEQTNNSATHAPGRGEPIEWAARFLLWMSDALITYVALV